MADTVKVGPWGAPGGVPRDVNAGSRPQRLKTITVSWAPCNSRITGFSYVYVDQNEEEITVGPWGTIHNENSEAIPIGPDEKLDLVSGTFHNSEGVTSLTLTTNQLVHGPYGSANGPEFSVPLRTGDGEVVAFFGSTSDTLNELGVYVLGKNGLPVMIGPWGGCSNLYINQPVKLESVTVYSAQRINGFSFTYLGVDGQPTEEGPWGATMGQNNILPMRPGEYVNNINGTFDASGLTSLEFTTSKGERVLYGRRTGRYFSVPLPHNAVVGNPSHNGAVLGFFGSSGGAGIPALGVYVGVAPQP